MTGYDIRKQVSESLTIATQTSYGTLYPTLHRLLEQASVSVEEIEQVARPAKKVYRMTDKGRAELARWLHKPPLEDKVKREFLLKLYFSQQVPDVGSVKLIAKRREKLQKALKNLRITRETTSNLRQCWLLDYAIAMHNAELEWLMSVDQSMSHT